MSEGGFPDEADLLRVQLRLVAQGVRPGRKGSLIVRSRTHFNEILKGFAQAGVHVEHFGGVRVEPWGLTVVLLVVYPSTLVPQNILKATACIAKITPILDAVCLIWVKVPILKVLVSYSA